LITTNLDRIKIASIIVPNSIFTSINSGFCVMKKRDRLLAAIGACLATVAFTLSASAYPALYFKFRKLRIPPSACVAKAKDIVNGLQDVGSNSYSSGGHTDTARVFVNCTTLPKAGPCNGDGASVMIVVASDKSTEDATTLLDRLDRSFGNPVLIDCNP
jgi:hypothetical protein